MDLRKRDKGNREKRVKARGLNCFIARWTESVKLKQSATTEATKVKKLYKEFHMGDINLSVANWKESLGTKAFRNLEECFFLFYLLALEVLGCWM